MKAVGFSVSEDRALRLRFTQIFQRVSLRRWDDGQWHSVKGAGPKILDFCDLSNRLTCRTIDGAIAASGLITVQGRRTRRRSRKRRSRTLRAGSCCIPNYEVQDARFNTNLSRVDGEAGSATDAAIEHGAVPATGERRQPRTDAGPGADERFACRLILGKGDVNRYYVRQLDRWHRETFRRLLRDGETALRKPERHRAGGRGRCEASLSQSEQLALDFYRGCIDDGCRRKCWCSASFARSKRPGASGTGAQQMKMMIGDKLITALPTMDERARNTALRMNARRAGRSNAGRPDFTRATTRRRLNDDHMALATLENNCLAAPGGKVLVDSETG
jgi:hypothetical protein